MRLTVSVDTDACVTQAEGGVAGHNAEIPARTFAELEEDDVDLFAETLLEHGIEAAPHAI